MACGKRVSRQESFHDGRNPPRFRSGSGALRARARQQQQPLTQVHSSDFGRLLLREENFAYKQDSNEQDLDDNANDKVLNTLWSSTPSRSFGASFEGYGILNEGMRAWLCRWLVGEWLRLFNPCLGWKG